MKMFFTFLVVTINITVAQKSIEVSGKRINYQNPNSAEWLLVQEAKPKPGFKGVLMFKHKPILDDEKRPIEPVFAIVYEQIDEVKDAIEYSVSCLGNKPYKISHKLLGGFSEYSSDMHSVVFKGEYVNSGVKHKVLLGYIYHDSVGIEIIADATEGVYSKVEKEMMQFLKSVNLAVK